MEFAEVETFLEQADPQDGVLLIKVHKGGGALEAHVLQLGLMSEAALERQMHLIYRAIVIKRYQLIQEQKNERDKNGAEIEHPTGGGSGAGVGKSAERQHRRAVGAHGKGGERIVQSAETAGASATGSDPLEDDE
jgi:hypothetical protein